MLIPLLLLAFLDLSIALAIPYSFDLVEEKGEKALYCNQEKIATLHLETGELRDMKLAPGGPPQLKAALTWLEANQIPHSPAILESHQRNRNGAEIELSLKSSIQDPKASTQNTVLISYDTTLKSFSYEFKGQAKLSEFSKRRTIEFNYLYPLYSALPSNDYTRELFFIGDLLFNSPIRTDWDDTPVETSLRPYNYGSPEAMSQLTGHFLARGPHSFRSPAVFFLPGHSRLSSCATCAYSHETHLGFDIREASTFQAHYRFVGLTPKTYEAFLKKSKAFSPLPQEVLKIIPKRGVNGFEHDQVVKPGEPVLTSVAQGTYSVSNSPQGNTLRLRPHDWIRFNQSSSKFSWKRAKFRALFEKKGDQEKLLVHSRQGSSQESVVIPSPHRHWFVVDLPLKGNTAKGPGSFEIYYTGEGKAWIDDLDLVEVPNAEALRFVQRLKGWWGSLF